MSETNLETTNSETHSETHPETNLKTHVFKLVRCRETGDSEREYYSLAPCRRAYRTAPNGDIERAELKYEMNKKTSCLPESAGIFVFPHLNHARDYARHFSKCAILECLFSGKLIRQTYAFVITSPFVTGYYLQPISKYWSFTTRAPKGTHTCESVTPIEELYTFKNYDILYVGRIRHK